MNKSDTYVRLEDQDKDNYPNKLIVHHTGGTDANPLADTSNHTAEIIEQWHLQKGWEGIGYHFVVEKDGRIVRGRPEHYHGAHSVGENKTSLGICLSGNFDATLPTEEQIKALRSLLMGLSAKYDTKEIVPHRKFANKSCYGTKLKDDWASNLINQSELEACQATLKEKDGIITLLIKLLRTLLGWK